MNGFGKSAGSGYGLLPGEAGRLLLILQPWPQKCRWPLSVLFRPAGGDGLTQPTMEQADTTQDSPAEVQPRKKHHWRRWVFAGLFLAFLGVLAVLPQLLSTAAMREQIASSLMQDFDGKVEIGGADLAWWKPAELSEMTMTDGQGETLATIKSAKVSTPLWRMFWPGSVPVELKVDKPRIVYEIDRYGRTNWAKVFGGLEAGQKPFRWPEFQHNGQPVHIRVSDGQVVVKDHVSGRTIEARDLNALVKKSPRFVEGELTGETRLTSAESGSRPAGNISADFQLAMAGNKVAGGDVSGEIKKTPLELIQPWLKQAMPHLHLSAGNADGKFESKWTGNLRTGLKLAVEGTLSADDVSAQSTKWEQQLTGAALTGKFHIDNTLPNSPGEFDIRWTLNNAELSDYRVAEEEAIDNRPVQPAVQPSPFDRVAFGDVVFETKGELDMLKQRVTLETARLASDVLTIDTAGTIDNFAVGPATLDLKGHSQGDILPVVYHFRPDLLGTLNGKRLTPEEFAIRGQLPAATQAVEKSERPDEDKIDPVREEAPNPFDEMPVDVAVEPPQPVDEPESTTATPVEPFSAVAQWTWESVEAYGVQSQSGGLWTRFEDQHLRVVPVDVKIGRNGQYLAKLDFDFSGKETILVVEEGYILRDVSFSEEMARSWLKYVAPVFAEATDLEGEFSLKVAEANMNWADKQFKELEGVLEIRESRLGPGPMVQQATAPLKGLMRFANRGEGELLADGARWVTLPRQSVPFKKMDGRIYHQELTFQTGKVSVVSAGSVGDDQTLDIAVTVPFDFIPSNRPIGQLFQDPIRILVTGTLSEPKIDASQIANVGKQIGINAVDGLLQGIFDRRRRGR